MNIVLCIAFFVLLIDLYNTLHLFRAPESNIVKNNTKVPTTNEARVFYAHCVGCKLDVEKQTLLLSLVQDMHTDKLVDFLENGNMLSIIDKCIYKTSFVSKVDNKINILAARVDGSPICFTQLTAYDNQYPRELEGSTLVILCVKT